MNLDSERYPVFGGLGDWFRFTPPGRERVLLREPEVCRQCGRTFISLYPLRFCDDHEGLDEL